MKKIPVLLLLSFCAIAAMAQTTTCEVSTEALKGTYEGECAKGKANGEGKAVGTDTYQGTFKNGLPDGTGKYTWKNGDYYFGSWKKGLMDGKGELHTTTDGKETVKTGFWKKNEYKGEYENPFVIYNTTTEVGRVEIQKTKGTGAAVTIHVEDIKNDGTQGSATRMTDLIVKKGNFMSRNSTVQVHSENTVLTTVKFPFRATYIFGNSSVDIEIFEEGTWEISIPIGK